MQEAGTVVTSLPGEVWTMVLGYGGPLAWAAHVRADAKLAAVLRFQRAWRLLEARAPRLGRIGGEHVAWGTRVLVRLPPSNWERGEVVALHFHQVCQYTVRRLEKLPMDSYVFLPHPLWCVRRRPTT